MDSMIFYDPTFLASLQLMVCLENGQCGVTARWTVMEGPGTDSGAVLGHSIMGHLVQGTSIRQRTATFILAQVGETQEIASN